MSTAVPWAAHQTSKTARFHLCKYKLTASMKTFWWNSAGNQRCSRRLSSCWKLTAGMRTLADSSYWYGRWSYYSQSIIYISWILMFFRVNDDERDNIDRAVDTLQMWWVVLHDTTSPWHRVLSCDATNEVAIQKMIGLKRSIQPMHRMVIVQDEKMLEDYICSMPHFIRQFLRAQDRYLTVIYPNAHHLAPSACNRDGSVPVRIIPSVDTPPIQMSRHVLRLLGKPIFVTTCAVGEGQIPPVYEAIENHIRSWVNLTSPLVFGVDDAGVFSMVIKYDREGHITVVRK